MRPTRPLALWLIVVSGCLSAGCGTVQGDGDPAAASVSAPATEGAHEALLAAFDAEGLSSISTAVAELDLNELTDAEEFTFFSPDDAAFTSLDADALADLLADPDALLALLRNHVVPQRLDRDDLADLQSVTTEAGNVLQIVVDGSDVTVGGARLVDGGDRLAGTSIVHVIDALLAPA